MEPAVILATHTAGLGVVRALGRMGVPIIAVCYDKKEDFGYLSKYVRRTIFAPHPERETEEFIGVLMSSGDTLSGSILIPSNDFTVVAVSRHKKLLERHYRVACNDWRVTSRFIDKRQTYEIAAAAGVPTPRTVIPSSAEDATRAGRMLGFPCLIKPCHGHTYYELFRRKMVKAETCEQLLASYRQATDSGAEVMIQEIIPGLDVDVVNYNAYFWEGEPLVEFTAEHTRNAPPSFGSPRVAMSKNIPEVIQPGRTTLRAIGFSGYACTEFKRDARDGVYKLMEVNGRHNLSTMLAVKCGINFPWIQYNHLLHGVVPGPAQFDVNMYWIDILRDLGYGLKYRKTEAYRMREYLAPYLGRHVHAVFDLTDLVPFLKRLSDSAGWLKRFDSL